MRDYSEYLMIPFDLQGFNCYSLVQLFYRKEFGIELPDYSLEKRRPIKSAEIIYQLGDDNGFACAKVPQYGDVLLLTENGRYQHLGVVVEDGYFLHTTKDTGTVIVPFRQGYWFNKVAAIFRHNSRS